MGKPAFLAKSTGIFADVLLFGGLVLLGIGLFLYRPWVSFSVCGMCLMAIGLFVGRKE